MSATVPTEQTGLAPCGWSWETLRGFRAGDAESLRSVYRGHAEEVARLLQRGFAFESSGRGHRFVGYASAFDLQDALQETFRRAFEPRARAAFDGVRPYGPYLRTIARNVVLRAFREQRELFPLADEDRHAAGAVALQDEDQPNPEVVAAREQMEAIVRTFMAGLAEADRRLLTVRFVDGLSQRDAAEHLGLGRQQIRSREVKLRAAMLAHLRRHDAATFSGGPGLAALAIGLPLLQLIHRGGV